MKKPNVTQMRPYYLTLQYFLQKEGMKGKDLKKLASYASDELKTYDYSKKKWCELIIDIFDLNV